MEKSMAQSLTKHMVVEGGFIAPGIVRWPVTLSFIHVEMNAVRNASGADGSIMFRDSNGVRKVIASYNHKLSLGKMFLGTNGAASTF